MYSLIILLPLISAIFIGLNDRSINKNAACKVASANVIISALISLYAFYVVVAKGEIIHISLLNWIKIGNIEANWSIYIDQLSALMIVVVTVVSSVVHVYSIGYMHDDPNISRFMSYLSLFTFSMLMLVLSDNFLQLFFGWEGVGLCSYLLIGFWYKKKSANSAAIKAFVVNRIGDFAFIIGMLTIIYYFGSLEFSKVFDQVLDINHEINLSYSIRINLIEFICFALFIGAMGKSAQIGLHVWLPDAMEGPTPVSALIHAATMVTAGVFLVARCSYIFEFAPIARDFIVAVGAVTALFAAIVAICQNDIKKIIAYSTCSQLGYMFIAAGLSLYNASIFHLATHAFFKAMLFLCAGSVIHAVHTQDITKMGGLWKYMPITYFFFWLGSLAIMGIFPLSGYYSKDLIINSAYFADTPMGNIAYSFGLLAAFCTAIYSMKIIMKVFHGEGASIAKGKSPNLDPPFVMNIPLSILAIGTIVVGYSLEEFFKISAPLYGFFKRSIFVREFNVEEHAPYYIELAPMVISFGGIAIGYILFASNLSHYLVKPIMPLYKLAKNKFYFDEIYDYFLVKKLEFLSYCSDIFDKYVIDFLGPNFVARVSMNFYRKVSAVHNGIISHYAFIMVFSLVFMLSMLVYKIVL